MAVASTIADHQAQQRHRALQDARDHVRRAASAAAAATCGEIETHRSAVLADARRRLLLTLRELEALS